jgi:hypothetical protein
MKNQAIQNLFNALRSLPDTKKFKFDYAVIKNMKTLTPIVQRFNNQLKITDELRAFDLERIKICEEFAEKKENGVPRIENGAYIFPNVEAEQECTKKIDELQTIEPHKTAIDEYEARAKEYEKYLQEETDVDLFKVKMENVPDGIPRPLLNEILPMIEE